MTDWVNRITGYGEESPDQLLANPHNHRIHPKRQQDALSGSLDTLGYIQTVIVNKSTGHIVDGHLRVTMALREGQKSIPVTYVDLTAEEEAQALLSLDPIAAMAATDRDKVDELLRLVNTDNEQVMKHLADFAAENKLDWGQPEQVDDEPQIERADELQEKWGVKEHDLWQCGNHLLLCGDSSKREDVFRVMRDEKATLLFTDPPYGVSIGDKNKFLNKFQKSGRVLTSIEADDDNAADLGDMLLQVFTLSKDFLAEDCSIFVCSPQGGSLGMMMMMMMRDAGMEVRHVLNWVKNSPTFSLGRLDYDYRHEPILFTWIKKHKKVMAGQFKNSVWEIDKPRANKEHPTMKPIELYENAILNHTDKGDILYEPFGGSGTGMIAAQNTGRVCRMVEIAPRYCSVILELFSAATGIQPVLLN